MDSIKYYKYFLNSGLISIDPKSGSIKAWVGGINHKHFKYDNVISKRQVGSTFKPFVYATAIDLFKYPPCLKVPNSQVVFEKDVYGLKEDYMPKNANKKVGKKIITIDLNEVKVGDLIVVTTGEKIPVDGLVIDGDSSVDQSSITGEFIPKNISLNDQVYAGTINIGSRIIIKTIKDPSESVMQKMIDLVSKAQKQKIPKQSRIDKIEK